MCVGWLVSNSCHKGQTRVTKRAEFFSFYLLKNVYKKNQGLPRPGDMYGWGDTSPLVKKSIRISWFSLLPRFTFNKISKGYKIIGNRDGKLIKVIFCYYHNALNYCNLQFNWYLFRHFYCVLACTWEYNWNSWCNLLG